MIDRVLYAQFLPLEDALAAMGVAVWPMTELEADDGLASAAHLAAEDPRVEKVCIWANDKDLAQCVRGDRVVQIIRKGMQVRNAEAVVDSCERTLDIKISGRPYRPNGLDRDAAIRLFTTVAERGLAG